MSSISPIAIVIILTAASAILLAVGLVLHRTGVLHSRGAAAGWAILTILPVFAGGWMTLFQPFA